MLVLADRRFAGAALWRKAQGVAPVWRVTTGTETAPAVQWIGCCQLGPGGHALTPTRGWALRWWSGCWSTPSMIPGRPQTAGQVSRLVTTILDATQAPTAGLAVRHR